MGRGPGKKRIGHMFTHVGKKLLLLAAAAVLAAGIAGCGGDKAADSKPAGEGKLVIAINSTFPPFESVKEGTSDYTGIDIDIAHYMAQKMGKTAEFTDMKFASLVPTLQSGRADMILSAISPTKERSEVVDFSIPYYFPMKAIICKKGAGYDSLDKLSGLSAGASMGTTYAKCTSGKRAASTWWKWTVRRSWCRISRTGVSRRGSLILRRQASSSSRIPIWKCTF